MKKFLNLIENINKVIKNATIIMLFLALAVIVLQVACRLLHIPLGWTEELARYLIVYVVYFAASLASREGLLTRLEVVTSVLVAKGFSERRVELLLNWIAGVFSILFYIIVIFCTTYTLKITKGQVSAALAIPMYIPYLGIYIGSILLLINTFASIVAQHYKQDERSLCE